MQTLDIKDSIKEEVIQTVDLNDSAELLNAEIINESININVGDPNTSFSRVGKIGAVCLTCGSKKPSNATVRMTVISSNFLSARKRHVKSRHKGISKNANIVDPDHPEAIKILKKFNLYKDKMTQSTIDFNSVSTEVTNFANVVSGTPKFEKVTVFKDCNMSGIKPFNLNDNSNNENSNYENSNNENSDISFKEVTLKIPSHISNASIFDALLNVFELEQLTLHNFEIKNVIQSNKCQSDNLLKSVKKLLCNYENTKKSKQDCNIPPHNETYKEVNKLVRFRNIEEFLNSSNLKNFIITKTGGDSFITHCKLCKEYILGGSLRTRKTTSLMSSICYRLERNISDLYDSSKFSRFKYNLKDHMMMNKTNLGYIHLEAFNEQKNT